MVLPSLTPENQWNVITAIIHKTRQTELRMLNTGCNSVYFPRIKYDHKVNMLALHLIQNCMVYINTLMIQKVLAHPHWNC
jgi:TnpA family transposase